MHQKTYVACAAVALAAVAFSCSKDSQTPASPSSTVPDATGAGSQGETLKATAPTPQSPVNNQQPDSLVLTTGAARASFGGDASNYSYEFEIRNSAGNAAVCPSATVASKGASSISWTSSCSLEFDQPYTWRVRAVFAGAVGPWSSNATFKAPAGGYIRGNEVMDPLTNSKTAGDVSGPVEFVQGEGIRLLDHSSFVTYRLPQNLQEGELSMMIKNADEGNPGDKSKVFSMQEGPDLNDITDDDYRMTAELRGRDYGAPGSVTFRIISGDGESRDGTRLQLGFESSRWYFWRFTWRTGHARLEVKRDGPNGATIYDQSEEGWSHPYRPDPHYIHLGAPVGRAGFIDATMPGILIKNVWASSRTRPAFPGEQ